MPLARPRLTVIPQFEPATGTPRPCSLAAIALGSNLSSQFGDLAANLREALQQLERLGRIAAVSSFYVTEPVGYLDQPLFLNAAALLETELDPYALLYELLAIEHAMGRDRSLAAPKGPRMIDLDLLLYDDVVLVTHNLILPHPSMHERWFVLAPLAEIAPGLQHSVLHRSIRELLAERPH